jgi:hypothetical protein
MTDQSTQVDRFDLVRVRLVWPQVLHAVRDISLATSTLLSNATLTAVNDDTITLALPTPAMARQLNDDRNRTVIEWALRNNTAGADWKVKFILASEENPPGPALPVTGDLSRLERADRSARALVLAVLAQNPTGRAIVESLQFMSTGGLHDLSTLARNLADYCDETVDLRQRSESKSQD